MTRFFLVNLLIAASLILSSCFKKDQQIEPHPRGNVLTDTIPMTENYLYQIYFDLESGKIISKNAKTMSDLGFECSPEGWKIILNTGDFMKAADLGIVPFGEVQDTTGKIMKFDKSDGNPDSLAIGTWFTVNGGDTVSNNHVYLIDRGLDENGNALGFYQVVFDSLKNGSYYFRVAPMKGGTVVHGNVTKDPSVNYLFYSIPAGGKVQSLEPPKASYDLLFTQYTTLLYTSTGEPYPYLVTGVLLNRYNVSAVIDTIDSFSSISLQSAQNMKLSASLDEIGYQWKVFNFNLGSYTVKENMVYIIRNRDGYYYKLRFIGFYNNLGQKGYPVIEYQML